MFFFEQIRTQGRVVLVRGDTVVVDSGQKILTRIVGKDERFLEGKTVDLIYPEPSKQNTSPLYPESCDRYGIPRRESSEWMVYHISFEEIDTRP